MHFTHRVGEISAEGRGFLGAQPQKAVGLVNEKQEVLQARILTMALVQTPVGGYKCRSSQIFVQRGDYAKEDILTHPRMYGRGFNLGIQLQPVVLARLEGGQPNKN